MATYVLPPGAWLSSSALHPGIGGNSQLHPGIGGNSQLHPGIGGNGQLQPGIGGNGQLQPGIGGSSQLQPGIGGNGPSHPGIGGGTPASRLAAAAARLTVAAPWRGSDPEWVYAGAEGLRAEALNRSSTRVMRRTDVRREAIDGPYVAARTGGTDEDDPLWRWGSEPRVHAVVSDLNWRFAVSDSCLWYLNRNDRTGRQVTFDESISFSAIPQNRHWVAEQVDQVLRAAIEREDRLPEILTQADDFMAFFVTQAGIDPSLAPITFEVIAAALRWATPLVMALKNQVAARRPHASSTRIVPLIETPAHGSLPSGHATMSALVAELLSELMFGKATRSHPRAVQLDRLARRIAFNRVVAGVHFPIDSRAGYALGLQLAAHFIGLATAVPQPGRHDLELQDLARRGLSETGSRPDLQAGRAASGGVAQSEVLRLLWEAACRELDQLGVHGVPL